MGTFISVLLLELLITATCILASNASKWIQLSVTYKATDPSTSYLGLNVISAIALGPVQQLLQVSKAREAMAINRVCASGLAAAVFFAWLGEVCNSRM